MRKRSRIVAAALAATGLTLAVVPAQAGSPKKAKRIVEVLDYYFTPPKMTVKKDTTVVWRWPAAGGDSHDVVLRKGPRGAKKFASDIYSANESFPQKLSVPGTYRIVCTLHEDEMHQTIVVTR